MMLSETGIVYLVGSGPGDPGLVTVRALKLLKEADAVVYDNLIPSGILANVRPGAELYNAGKQAGRHRMKQDEINSLLCRLAGEGKSVVRLKGGDPFIFGRGSEEALALKNSGYTFEIVPGVTSGSAAPAYAGIPVTHSGISTSVHFITGHEDPTKPDTQVDLKALAALQGTLVFFMGVGNIAHIAERLIAHGKSEDTPCAVIRHGCTARQLTVAGKLSEIARLVELNGIKPPALICIGEVCRFHDELSWYESLPLFGRTIVVTRTRSQALRLSSTLVSLGAEVLECPAIDIRPTDLTRTDLDKIGNLQNYNWVMFTSQNAVEQLFDNLEKIGLDARAFAGIKIAAIGGATADALRMKGLNADLVPSTFTSKGLLEAFTALPPDDRGNRVLLPRADIASRELPDGLSALGIEYDEIAVYETRPGNPDPVTMERISYGEMDFVTFTSSSTVENFARMTGNEKFVELSKNAYYISIGPVTSNTLRTLGARVSSEAEKSDIEGLVKAILDFAGAYEA